MSDAIQPGTTQWVPEKRYRNTYTDANPPQALEWHPDVVREEGDELIPGDGFIKDFVYWTKGIESPTQLAIWSALWLLSSMAKRDVWFKWQPDFPLFPNLYVIIVAPPGINKKSTMIGRAGFLGHLAPMTIGDLYMASKKMLTVHRGKITPEGLHDLMVPESPYWLDHKNGDGKTRPAKIDRGSQIALQISELTTFLSKAKYNIGLVDKLTKLYDCDEVDDEYTKGGGGTKLRKIYATFIGATTPDGIRMSIPEEAFGGGFMSRAIVVYSEKITRFYHRPIVPPGAPETQDMAMRLGWLMERAQGEYDLSPEADAEHQEWYRPFKLGLLKRSEEQMHLRSRMDNILLRLATLVRIQRYEPGNTISLSDYRFARNILVSTMHDSSDMYDDVGATDYGENTNRLKRWVRRKGEVSWRSAQQRMSRYISSDELAECFQSLFDAGLVEVYTDGSKVTRVERKAGTVFHWVGPDDNEVED
jgi:hypothetical protein